MYNIKSTSLMGPREQKKKVYKERNNLSTEATMGGRQFLKPNKNSPSFIVMNANSISRVFTSKKKKNERAGDSNLQPQGSGALFCIAASLLGNLCPHIGNFLSISNLSITMQLYAYGGGRNNDLKREEQNMEIYKTAYEKP